MSKVLPILFNTDMVRAILDGRKTVTRRLVKQQPTERLTCGQKKVAAPYQPGDILYIRETWSEWTGGYVYKAWSGPFPQPGKASVMKWHPSIHMPKEAARLFLRVKDVRMERLQEITEEQAKAEGIREYSKDGNLYKYAVTDDWWIDYHNKHRKTFLGTWWQDMPRTAKDAFSYLWNSTIKKSDLDRYGWNANPWVWVIEFERIKTE